MKISILKISEKDKQRIKRNQQIREAKKQKNKKRRKYSYSKTGRRISYLFEELD